MRLNRRSRVSGVALGVAAGLILAACSGGDSNGGGNPDAPDSTDEIISINSTQPQNPLIPAATNEVGGGNVIDMMFAGLVSYSLEGEVENEVAESLEANDDFTEWTITVEDGWTFHDGTPVTADSFVDAWNLSADPENGFSGAFFYSNIEGTDDGGTAADGISGLEVVDESTFTVALKEPESEFPVRLGYSAYFPLPETAIEDIDAFGRAPVGNGPYEFESWEDDVQIMLAASEDYEGNREARNGGLEFRLFTDPEAAYTEVQAGTLDIIDAVPPSALGTYQDDGTVVGYSGPGAANGSIAISFEQEGFGDNEAGQLRRQALSRAIDREAIAERIFEGSRSPAREFSAPTIPGYSDSIEGNEVLDFDPEIARELWDEAESIESFEGTLQVSSNSDGAGNQEFIEAVANQWRDTFEIDVEPDFYPNFGEFRTLVVDGDVLGPYRSGWQGQWPSQSYYLGPQYQTGGGSNDYGYSNPEFDATLIEALGIEDEDERNAKFNEAQEFLMQDLPQIPVFTRDVAAASTSEIGNLEFTWNDRPALHLVTK